MDANHHAFALLAASPDGVSPPLLAAHGISAGVIAELIEAGHVTEQCVGRGKRPVARIKITWSRRPGRNGVRRGRRDPR